MLKVIGIVGLIGVGLLVVAAIGFLKIGQVWAYLHWNDYNDRSL